MTSAPLTAVRKERLSKDENFDVCIIGSGAAGGVMAKELCEGGAKWPYELPFRGFRGEKQAPFNQGDIAKSIAFADSDEVVIDRVRVLGGKTMHWNAVALRYAPRDFKEWSLQGIAATRSVEMPALRSNSCRCWAWSKLPMVSCTRASSGASWVRRLPCQPYPRCLGSVQRTQARKTNHPSLSNTVSNARKWLASNPGPTTRLRPLLRRISIALSADDEHASPSADFSFTDTKLAASASTKRFFQS
jgi:hypothetical protein